MTPGDALAGSAWFAAVFAPLGYATVLILGTRLADLRGSQRLLAGFIVLYASVIVVYVVPGALGLLGRGSVAVTAVAVAVGARMLLGPLPKRETRPTPDFFARAETP